jgi:hypothetical protein
MSAEGREALGTAGQPPQQVQITRWGPRSATPASTNHSLGTPVSHPSKYKSLAGDPGQETGGTTFSGL